MSETFTNILTKIGQQKKAQAEANNAPMEITTFKVGDGNGSYYEQNENQTALINVKYTGTFVAGTQSQIIVNQTAINEVLYKCFIPADVGGFTIRELGLFDEDNDLILICKLPAQDKFALASGLYQPLTFTPKIIYTNPQSQAVLTPTSQTVPTTGEVATLIQEGISESLEGINYNAPIKNAGGEISLDFDDTLKLTSGKLGVAKAANPTKFCFNSGNTTGGVADLLNYLGLVISTKSGGIYANAVGTNINGLEISINSVLSLTLPSVSGSYNLFITEAGLLEAFATNLYKQSSAPISPVLNSIWLDTSIEPLMVKKHNGANWEVYTGIPIGTATVASGAITAIKTNPYNQNGYDANIQSLEPKTTFTQALLNSEAPNFSNPVTIAYGVNVPILVNGWVSVYFYNSGGTFRVNGVDHLYCNANGAYYDTNSAFYRVGRGDIIWSNAATVRFYQCKGEC